MIKVLSGVATTTQYGLSVYNVCAIPSKDCIEMNRNSPLLQSMQLLQIQSCYSILTCSDLLKTKLP